MPDLVVARRSLTLSNFARALRDLAPWDTPAVVDLSATEFVGPFGLAGLASVISNRMAACGDVQVRKPQHFSCANYLSRMGFGDLLQDLGVPCDSPIYPVSHQDHAGYLVELARFQDTHGSDGIANIVWQRLHGNVENGVVMGMHEATAELGANVSEHSASQVGGFIAAQTFYRDQRNEHLVIAVADAGIGLRESLQRYGTLDDSQAISLALQRDVSGTDEPGRGQGLADLVEFVQTYGGTMVVLSGRTQRTVHPRWAADQAVSHCVGTVIGAKVKCRP